MGEAVIVVVDNSENSRNGDFRPSRMHSQFEALRVVARKKLAESARTRVGVVTMSGNVRVVVSHTQEVGQLLQSMHEVAVGGHISLLSALRTAQLALQNRLDKGLYQRVILFVCSALKAGKEMDSVFKLGKALRKDQVAVDVVSFGTRKSVDANDELIQKFIDILNKDADQRGGADYDATSHYLKVYSGQHLADTVEISPICLGGAAGAAGGVGGAAGMGMGMGAGLDNGGMEMDDALARAIAASLEQVQPRPDNQGGAGAEGADEEDAEEESDSSDSDLDDPDILRAMQMSLVENNDNGDGGNAANDAGQNANVQQDIVDAIPAGDDLDIDTLLDELAGDEEEESDQEN